MLCAALVLQYVSYAQLPPIGDLKAKAAKPLLFSSLPDSFEVDKHQLQKIFTANVNDDIYLQLSSQFLVIGQVVDKRQHTPGTVSVNIRVTNYANALFNLTVRLLADNSSTIRGRVLHPKFGDVLILERDADTYYIKKKSQALLLPD